MGIVQFMKGVNKAISDKSLTVYHEKLMLEVDSLYGFGKCVVSHN